MSNGSSSGTKSWAEVAKAAEMAKRTMDVKHTKVALKHAKADSSNMPQSDLHRPQTTSAGNSSAATTKTWAQVAAEVKKRPQSSSATSAGSNRRTISQSTIPSATPASTAVDRTKRGNRHSSASVPPSHATAQNPMATAGRSARNKKKDAAKETPMAAAGRSAPDKKEYFVLVPKAVGELLSLLELSRESLEIKAPTGHLNIRQLLSQYSTSAPGTIEDMRVPRKDFYAFIAPLLSGTEHVFRFAIQDESGRTVQIKPAAYQAAQTTLINRLTQNLKNEHRRV
jgi:hypothetical protein